MMKRDPSNLKEAVLSYAVAKAIGTVAWHDGDDDRQGYWTTSYAGQELIVGHGFHPALNEEQALEIAAAAGVTVATVDAKPGSPSGFSACLGDVVETHQVKSYAICRVIAKATFGEAVEVPAAVSSPPGLNQLKPKAKPEPAPRPTGGPPPGPPPSPKP